MNNIFKFSLGIFATLAAAWLAFVVGARQQFGDLAPTSTELEEDGSIPEDADLFPIALSGIAQQGASEYLSLGCSTCHTQQVRLVESGFDVERGWGKRPSVARDYILQNEVNLGNTRVGPDLANLGLRDYSDEWLHQHLFEPQSLIPESICPPSPFLYTQEEEKKSGVIEFLSDDNKTIHIKPSTRAQRIVAYLQELAQDYELPEISFIGEEDEQDTNSTKLPEWLSSQIASGKEIYMKAAPGGGLCFTCHQPTGLGLAGQFPPLAGSDWVLGDKERLIKISLFGLMGEINVNGIKYNGVMPPPGIPPGSLTDQQVADVLTYIRNDWGNSASAVSPEEVGNVRANIKDRAPMQMWTSAELDSKNER
ncbi:MAG: c-type cytochrome [Opitutae bacterium]|jgi:cytochrome c oxidase cbb3-type subunit II|nr:c-type cytochrome [Opitutae bacterium]